VIVEVTVVATGVPDPDEPLGDPDEPDPEGLTPDPDDEGKALPELEDGAA